MITGRKPFLNIPAALLKVADRLVDQLKWSCFLGQFCGSAKMHLVYVHAAFRISAWVKYAVSGVRLSRAV